MDFFFLRIQLFVVEMIKQMSSEKIIDFLKKNLGGLTKICMTSNLGMLVNFHKPASSSTSLLSPPFSYSLLRSTPTSPG